MSTAADGAAPDVVRKVSSIVAAQLNVDAADISPGSHLVEDLGMDSLSASEIVAQLEDDFDIQFGLDSLSQLAHVQTLADLAATVGACLPAGGAPPA